MLSSLFHYTAFGAGRLARLLLLALVLFCTVTLLGLRYWVLPNIERYHAVIEYEAGLQVGRKVTIGQIEADWNGFRPRLLLSDVRVLDEQGQVALRFPLLRNTVAWTTLFTGELRFHSLELVAPQLLVRRDSAGRRYVAGIASADTTSVSSDVSGLDWLLHQSRIVILNGRIVWQDELRGAPPVTFDQLDMVIENRGDRHRIAVLATPPSQLATPINLRAELHGASFAAPQDWHGEVYARMDHTDVASWRTWFDLPQGLRHGQGGVRLWLGWQGGQPVSVLADVDLRGVDARLREDLPTLALQRMQGRIGWRQVDQGIEVSADKLSMRLADGFSLRPTTFLFNLMPASGYRSASGEIRADALDLGDINRVLAYLPVQAELKQRLTALAPQGHVQDMHASWQGEFGQLLRYEVRARFQHLALRQVGDLPGFSGLSGEVSGSDSAGQLSLDSRDLHIAAPGFLSEALDFDRVYGQLDWQRNSQRGWDFKLNKVLVANADARGTVYGSYQTGSGAGSADLTLSLTQVAVKHAARYIPVQAFNAETYRWLQTGLQGGIADTFQMRVRGDLDGFPFPDSKQGLFRLTAKAHDVVIEFDPGWPRIEQAQADLLIQGRLLEVKAAHAMTAGAALQNVRVALPDMLSDHLVMEVDGEAADQTERSLDYIRNSPVRGYLDGYTDSFHAKGGGLLRLSLRIPLDGEGDTQVRGSYRVDGNDLDLGANIPLLRLVNGTLQFSGEEIEAKDVSVRILGGPARLSLRNEGSTLRVDASGTLDADNLYPAYGIPVLARLHGKAGWQAEIGVKDKLAHIRIDSDLQGLSSTLPPPFDKPAEQKVALHFQQQDLNARQQSLKLQYGDLLRAQLLRQSDEEGQVTIRRGDIVFGSAGAAAAREGIWITGHLPYLSLQGWEAGGAAQGGSLPDIARIDVRLDRVAGYGSTLHDVHILGSGRNGLVSTRLDAREAAGDLIWQPQDEGRLYVRMKHLQLGEQDAEPLPAVSAERAPRQNTPLVLPEIDVAVEQLSWQGRELGKLELMLDDEQGAAVLRRLRLTNPDGTLEADGSWRPQQDETRVKARIEIADAGHILARSGYPQSLRGGGGVLESELAWHGAPDTLDYASLNGSLYLKTGKGRFLQVDPGAAKLLGVLSLQALPKRISLDFTDVFTPGFEFSSIEGHAAIRDGILRTDDFKLTGSAAKVTLQGTVDLQQETQQLKVRVLPSLGDNVSLLSFAAGPAVGVGVLLTNKLLRDPLDKLVAFDYNVSGSWADPKVERAGVADKTDTGKPDSQPQNH